MYEGAEPPTILAPTIQNIRKMTIKRFIRIENSILNTFFPTKVLIEHSIWLDLMLYDYCIGVKFTMSSSSRGSGSIKIFSRTKNAWN